MSRVIHIGKNGPAICPAKKACRLKNPDGTPATHYETWDDAGAAFEKILEEEHGATTTVTPDYSPARKTLEAAGVEYPANWDEMGSSEKDLWEDTQLQSLNKQSETSKDKAKKPSFSPPKAISIDGYMGSKGWQGGNYDASKYTPLKEVAQNVRKDLKDATAAGWLPKGLKYSVRVSNNALHLDVVNLPSDKEVYNYERDFTGTMRKVLKPEYLELESKLQQIHDSYNYNRSNSMVDYFDRGYYGKVEFLDDSDKTWNESEKRLNHLKREYKKFRANGVSNKDLLEDENFKKTVDDYIEAKSKYYEATAEAHVRRNEWKTGVIVPDDKVKEESALYVESRTNAERARIMATLG